MLMNVRLMEVDVNIIVVTLSDHLSVFVNKASVSLVMDYNAMVKLLLSSLWTIDYDVCGWIDAYG